jgi:hypothetical protein
VDRLGRPALPAAVSVKPEIDAQLPGVVTSLGAKSRVPWLGDATGVMGNPSCALRSGTPKALLASGFRGADDGTRTRDPHLGKAKALLAGVRWNRSSPGQRRASTARDRWNRSNPLHWSSRWSSRTSLPGQSFSGKAVRLLHVSRQGGRADGEVAHAVVHPKGFVGKVGLGANSRSNGKSGYRRHRFAPDERTGTRLPHPRRRHLQRHPHRRRHPDPVRLAIQLDTTFVANGTYALTASPQTRPATSAAA